MNELADRKIVAKFLQSRNEDLFQQLYRRHTPRLYLFSLRLCAGNHHKAEDLVQETWIRAVQNLPRFEWRSALSSWLSGIALNCYREQRIRQEETWQIKVEPPSEDENLDRSLDLEQLIQRLPNGCREVFVLHDIEGYTHEEIGSLLNIGNGTSKSQLFEARKKLRNWLSPGRLDGRTEETR